jgi:hypothetical protein
VIRARPAEPVVLSVNYPATRVGAASMLTRAGRRDYPRADVPEWAGDGDVHRMYLFGEPDEIIPEAYASLGTDIAALRAGYVSVTPLSFAVELGDLSPGFQAFHPLDQVLPARQRWPFLRGPGASRWCRSVRMPRMIGLLRYLRTGATTAVLRR